MTTNPSIFNQIRKVIDDINEEVDSEDVDEPDAAEIIKNLTKEGGGIEVLGDSFEPKHEHVKDVQNRIKEEYGNTYGLDGSTTKDLSFNNGLIVSISVAAAGVANSDKVEDISEKSTISVTVYFDDNDLDINPESTDKSQVFFDQFPRVTELTSDLPDWINSISRTNAEGKHFEWISSDIDGPLFIDGPVLPPDILIWSAYYNEGDNIHRTPMRDWPDKVHDILQSYINGIENCVVSDNPVFGVQKSTTATRVIDALIDKEPELTKRQIPWHNDSVLFNSALQDDSDDTTISYTPWYIENEFYVGGKHGYVTPLKGYEDIDLELGSYEEYKRAFFFAKPPTQTTVCRIGVPKLCLQMYDKDRLRDIALNEMIKQFREPLPVVIADEKVRIPKNMREEFRSLITQKAHKGINEQRNYK
jgi:hypothetical protein